MHGFDTERLRRSAAHNLAVWHEASVLALGLPSRWTDRWWTTTLPGPTIYHSAVALAPVGGSVDAAASAVAELRHHLRHESAGYRSIGDPFGDLPLEQLGLRRQGAGPWFARPAGPPPRTAWADDLEVVQVRTPDLMAAVEQTMAAAFSAPFPIARGEVHHPRILDDDRLVTFAGLQDGHAVSISMACITDVVGVYGVGTAHHARGHGYATAVTAACLAIRPDLPTVLQPSPAAESLYRRLGFDEIGRHAHWR